MASGTFACFQGNPDNPFIQLLHEPNISLSLDQQGVSLQESITLINFNWWPLWLPQIENGVSLLATQHFNGFTGEFGVQDQTEFHLYGGLSFALSGTLNASKEGGNLTFTPGAGISILFHLDGGKYQRPEIVQMQCEPPFGAGCPEPNTSDKPY